VPLRTADIAGVELDHVLDEAGFRHAATSVRDRLGAQRIGAGVYEAEEGFPIWPYHYHHGVEEWLYVFAGAPVLRDPSGERALEPGDLVCFPSGPLGAHTVKGPGRVVIFSAGRPPYMGVYPDSDKASGPEGILLRSSAVGYWHGEGTAGPQEPDAWARREPETSSALPVGNVLAGVTEIGPALGAELLEGRVVDLGPGAESEPYSYVYGREVWLLTLAGTVTVRHPDGEDAVEAGTLVCFAEGPGGAHQLLNRGESAVRALVISTTELPANVCYPDTGRWLLRNAPGVEENL
jgi:uncharacterized cupin superfamily protein